MPSWKPWSRGGPTRRADRGREGLVRGRPEEIAAARGSRGSDAAGRILDTVSDIGFRSSTRGDARAPRLDPYLRGSRDRHGHSGGHCYGQRGRRSARRRRLRACVSAERALPFPENATVRRKPRDLLARKSTRRIRPRDSSRPCHLRVFEILIEATGKDSRKSLVCRIISRPVMTQESRSYVLQYVGCFHGSCISFSSCILLTHLVENVRHSRGHDGGLDGRARLELGYPWYVGMLADEDVATVRDVLVKVGLHCGGGGTLEDPDSAKTRSAAETEAAFHRSQSAPPRRRCRLPGTSPRRARTA